MTRNEEARALLDALLGPMADRLRDVNLPLYILLEGRFGELNDNQLEMIHAAQDAAEAADRVLRDVQRLLDVKEGAPAPGVDVVRVVDLLRAALLVASAAAENVGTKLELDVPPQLPHVRVNRSAVEEAMTTVLLQAVREQQNGFLRVTTTRAASSVVVTIDPWRMTAPVDLGVSLAGALLRDCLGDLQVKAGALVVTLPAAVWEPADC